jgi:cation diffusion facilitator family transporter
MISLLTKIFIQDRENVSNPVVRQKYGVLCSIVGIGLNLVLFVGKYLAGAISGSIAITADAFNNLSDAGSSIITLVGFNFSGRKADAEHPFGHGRVEYISGFIVSMAIILVGFELAKASISKIIAPSPIDTSMISIAILCVSIAIKGYMATYNRRIGMKIDSAAMRATSVDSLSDTVATSVVLVSMIIMHFTGVVIDGWGGILVALFILYSGYNAAKDTMTPLLGKMPDADFVKRIEEIVLSHEEIIGIHDLVVHDYGPGRIMISLHGEVSGDGDIFVLHDVIDQIEQELNQALQCEAVIHMDPVALRDERVMRMHREVDEMIQNISRDIHIHDFRIVKGPTHTNVIFDAVVPFEFALSDNEVKSRIENMIRTKWEDCVPVVKIDKSYVADTPHRGKT